MYNKVASILKTHEICVYGILHIGANLCEELPLYQEYIGLCPQDIIWIDAFSANISAAKHRNIPNVYHETITNKDHDVIDFHILNDTSRSTIITKDIHQCIYRISQSTITVPTFLKKHGLSPAAFNFWSIHIEGAEWIALLGAEPDIEYIDALCIDVSQNIVEINTFLREKGFSRVFQEKNKAFYIRIQNK